MVECGGLRLRKVGHTKGAHFARSHRCIERARDLLRVGQNIRAVDLPQVNRIRLEPPQRSINCFVQIVRALVIGQRRLDPALGRQHHSRTQARLGRQHFAQQSLGIAEPAAAIEAVNVRRIEQGDPGIERSMDQPRRFGG